jgi:hypothetical protein
MAESGEGDTIYFEGDPLGRVAIHIQGKQDDIMTTYDVEIVDANGNNPVYGDDVDVIRTVTGMDSGQSIDKAWLTIKQRFTQEDSAALLQHEITQVLTPAGQVTDPGSGSVGGELLFRIVDTDYDDLLPLKAYLYDIQVLLSDGVINTLEVGTVMWEKQVTITRT